MSPKLLLISPGFHGYHRSVARAFETLNYQVKTFCYDVARSNGERAWNKVRHELPAVLAGGDGHMSAEQASGRALAVVRQFRPDVVLVVRGDVLSEDFWAEAASGSSVGVWMYDEIRRTKFDADLVAKYASIATYSALDAKALQDNSIDALHVHLGFDDSRPTSGYAGAAGLVSFVGAPSPRRAAALRALTAAGIAVRAWGRGWSDHPFDRARTWRAKGVGLPNGRDVTSEVAQAIMRSSSATLNIHGDQDGFTMRTFEAAGVGAVQLIDRLDVGEVYLPGEEVLVFDGEDDLVQTARRVVARPQDFVLLRERARARTLAEHTFTHRARELERLWR
ncbi:hypothetical protein GCM10027599_11000 [Yimella radicis]